MIYISKILPINTISKEKNHNTIHQSINKNIDNEPTISFSTYLDDEIDKLNQSINK